MKKTLNVNIGSVAFTIDDDAYQVLSRYYDDVRSRLYDEERQEVMFDVEARTADIFRDNLTYPSQVVSVDLVRVAMATIGSAESFGDKRYEHSGGDTEPREKPVSRRLYRSRSDRMLGGVCGGLADYFNIDPTLVRILMVVLLLAGSAGFWIYLLLWILIPEEPAVRVRDRYRRKKQEYTDDYYSRKEGRR